LTVPATSSTGSYSASWTSVAAATRYELQQRKDAGAWGNVHNADATSKALNGLSSGSYEYRVRACNVGGCAGWSGAKTTVVTLPDALPIALTVPATSSTGSYTATWTAVAAATRYELQQSGNGGGWSNVHNAAAT